MAITDEQLAGLFENIDATDVPENLRRGMALEAWEKAIMYYAALRMLHGADREFEEFSSDPVFSCTWAVRSSAHWTGAFMDLAEGFVRDEVETWRNSGETPMEYEPWAQYKPDISPALQRKVAGSPPEQTSGPARQRATERAMRGRHTQAD